MVVREVAKGAGKGLKAGYILPNVAFCIKLL